MAEITDIAIGLDDLSGLLDLTVFAGDIDTDNALLVAVLSSLFSDARAEDGDGLPAGDDPRGWWGDSYAATAGDRHGCRWWVRRREIVTDELARWYAATGTEALAWMVRDGWAKTARVRAWRNRARRHALVVIAEIVRPDGSALTVDVSKAWEGLTNG